MNYLGTTAFHKQLLVPHKPFNDFDSTFTSILPIKTCMLRTFRGFLHVNPLHLYDNHFSYRYENTWLTNRRNIHATSKHFPPLFIRFIAYTCSWTWSCSCSIHIKWMCHKIYWTQKTDYTDHLISHWQKFPFPILKHTRKQMYDPHGPTRKTHHLRIQSRITSKRSMSVPPTCQRPCTPFSVDAMDVL